MGVRSTSRGHRVVKDHVDHLCIHTETIYTHPCVCPRRRDHVQLSDVGMVADEQNTLFELD